ncbi:hypothetical protein [Bradyrhizobium sp. Leo121]|uniref:hypothetical protein n=1 Tax=Bradyrhizobium sp. Leo121 TaxID=1571195 RepID=UPI00102894EB|nr:hypothetical protein [Bradyrhizobium sp. Leo121]RZN30484.1 hypothetical protein CWO90_20320 [Bradyrhizobium sp. Leo121]
MSIGTAAERQMLHEMGTKLSVLKPSSIIGAAKNDLALRDRKRNAEFIDDELQREHYAFHRRHVAKAASVAELLQKAIDERAIGLSSGKFNTRMIYENTPLLRAALAEIA